MPMISIVPSSGAALTGSEELLENVGKSLHEKMKSWGRGFRLNIEHQPENAVRMIDAEGNMDVFSGVLVKVLLSDRNNGEFIEELIGSLKSSVAGVMGLDESEVTILVQQTAKGCFLINNEIV